VIVQVTHTHSHETCPGAHTDRLSTFSQWWNGVKKNPNLKVLGGYVSPIDHVFHITLEADDYTTVVRAMGPLNSIGTGHISGVITLDAAMPLAEEGVFRG
jgi:hypothetical protein